MTVLIIDLPLTLLLLLPSPSSFVHYKLHMEWPGIKLATLLSEAIDKIAWAELRPNDFEKSVA